MTTHLHVWGYADGCPACTNLKTLLTLLGFSFTFHSIHRDGAQRAALRDAGFDTVPQVFTPEGLHIGDYQVFRKAAGAAVETLSSPSGQV